jgi:hypothetical protein
VYAIRLTATRGVEDDSHQIVLAVPSPPMVGWPKDASEGSGYSKIQSSASYADVDDDGDLEIFIKNNLGTIYAWHHDGSPVDGWPVSHGIGQSNWMGSPSIGDIDGDGDLEVVETTYYGGGSVYAYHHDGSLVAGWPVTSPASIAAAAALEDLDGDGALEIIVGGMLGGPGSMSQVHVFKGDGAAFPGWPVTLPDYNLRATPAVGDIDGDGDFEIIAHPYYNIYAFHHDGTPVAGWPVPLSSTHISPIIATPDPGVSPVVIAFSQAGVRMLASNGATVYAIPLADLTGQVTAAVGKIEQQGDLIICITSAADGRVYLASLTAGLLPGWPQMLAGDPRGCVLADVDGDRRQDVIVSVRDSQIHAWKADGTLMFSDRWPKVLSAPIWATPTIQDHDGDGVLELVIGDEAANVFMYELDESLGSSPPEWPIIQGSPRHTGVYPLEPTGLPVPVLPHWPVLILALGLSGIAVTRLMSS